MQGDLNFSFVELYPGWGARAARSAVLLPLFGQGRGIQGLLAQSRKCQAAWRARVSDLVGAHSRIVNSPYWARKARNCPPAFVEQSIKSWPCGNTRICPFCYAREIVKVWQAASRSFDDFFAMPRGASPFKILERRVRLRGPLESVASIADTIRNINCRNRLAFERFEAVGGFCCSRIEPLDHPDTWTLSVRQLFKVPATIRIDPPSPNEQLKVHERPTKTALCAAIARTGRFPTKLLRAPVERVAMILDALATARCRTSAMFGDFRGNAF